MNQKVVMVLGFGAVGCCVLLTIWSVFFGPKNLADRYCRYFAQKEAVDPRDYTGIDFIWDRQPEPGELYRTVVVFEDESRAFYVVRDDRSRDCWID